MKSRVLVSTAIMALLALGGCGKQSKDDAGKAADKVAGAEASTEAASTPSSESAKAVVDPAAAKAENEAKSRAFLTENSEKEGVLVTESGLQYEVLQEGPKEGAAPLATDIVDVHYVGTLIDGIEFDSSRKRGAASRFPLNQVIRGWTEGLQLMTEGDRFRFYIPAELAYGENAPPNIGPNQALIFDVELLKVTNPERNLAASKAFLEENGKKKDVKKTASGLQYQILSEGPSDGKSPSDANIVKLNYEGKLIGGEIFDSTFDAGNPVEFPLGQFPLQGWIEGVQLMSEGDKFRFFVPPELAFGQAGTPGGPIGPNEALIFELELLEVKE